MGKDDSQRKKKGCTKTGREGCKACTCTGITHNPAALYRADKAAWQKMRLHKADPDVVAYQEIRLQGKDYILCTQMYNRVATVPAGVSTRHAIVVAQRPQRAT